jgi:hypothetical protein
MSWPGLPPDLTDAESLGGMPGELIWRVRTGDGSAILWQPAPQAAALDPAHPGDLPIVAAGPGPGGGISYLMADHDPGACLGIAAPHWTVEQTMHALEELAGRCVGRRSPISPAGIIAQDDRLRLLPACIATVRRESGGIWHAVPPEGLAGPVTEAQLVYGLAAVAALLLCAMPPVATDTDAASAYARDWRAVFDPRRINPGLVVPASDLVLDGLDPDPARRPDIAGFLARCRAVLVDVPSFDAVTDAPEISFGGLADEPEPPPPQGRTRPVTRPITLHPARRGTGSIARRPPTAPAASADRTPAPPSATSSLPIIVAVVGLVGIAAGLAFWPRGAPLQAPDPAAVPETTTPVVAAPRPPLTVRLPPPITADPKREGWVVATAVACGSATAARYLAGDTLVDIQKPAATGLAGGHLAAVRRVALIPPHLFGSVRSGPAVWTIPTAEPGAVVVVRVFLIEPTRQRERHRRFRIRAAGATTAVDTRTQFPDRSWGVADLAVTVPADGRIPVAIEPISGAPALVVALQILVPPPA